VLSNTVRGYRNWDNMQSGPMLSAYVVYQLEEMDWNDLILKNVTNISTQSVTKTVAED
jgi:hypothetical protein